MPVNDEWVQMRVGPYLPGLGVPSVLICVKRVASGHVGEAFIVLRDWVESKFDLVFMDVSVAEPAGVYADAGLNFDVPFVTERVIETAWEYIRLEQEKASLEAGNSVALPQDWTFMPAPWRERFCLLKLDGAPDHLFETIGQTSWCEEVRQFMPALAAANQPFALAQDLTRRTFREAWRTSPPSPIVPP